MYKFSSLRKSHSLREVVSTIFVAANCDRKLLTLVFLIFFLIPTNIVYSDSSTSVEDKPKEEVTVRDKKLQGRIIQLSPKGIKFATIYGKGEITISYKDIEEVLSQRKFLIFYGEDQLARGRLFGIEDGQLLVGSDMSSARRVPVNEIITGVSQESYDESLWTRFKTNFRYWHGSYNLGYTYEEGAVDKNKVETSIDLRRRKKPTHFFFDLRYAFENEQFGGKPEKTTKNELEISLTGAYDFKGSVFVFVRPAYEFDKPRNIDYRWYPAAGIGYRIVEKEDKETLLMIPFGIGYVYEDFGGIGTNSFLSWFLGLQGSYEFGHGIILSAAALYMPKITDPSEDWLFRALLDLTVPIFDPIAVKLRLTNTNDNNPTEEVGDNKFVASLLLSLVF